MSCEHGVDYHRVNTGLFVDDGSNSFDADSADVEMEEEGEHRRKNLRLRTAFCLAPMAVAFLLFCIFFYSKSHGIVEEYSAAKEEEYEGSDKVSIIEGKQSVPWNDSREGQRLLLHDPAWRIRRRNF